jgi:hypothetical protein
MSRKQPRRPKRLFRSRRPVDAAGQFREAMATVHAEDRAIGAFAVECLQRVSLSRLKGGMGEAATFALKEARDGPPYRCWLCKTATNFLVSWEPDEESSRRDFRVTTRVAAVIYPLCASCIGRAQQGDTDLTAVIEGSILSQLRADGLIPSPGGSMS